MFGTVTRYYEDKGYGFGDIKGIREEKNLGRKTNQQLHSLPYARIYMQLEYKLNVRHSQKKYRAFMQRKRIGRSAASTL